MIDTLCAEIVFFLVIPLVRKDKATLGKMAMKLSIINKGDYKASNLQIVARFLSIYLIETVFSYFFFGAIAIVIIPLVNVGFYSFEKHKIFIHDFFAGTKVVETESSVIFDTLEEKEEYYIQKAKNDEEYALKREEQRKISGINMDGYNEK